MVGGMRSMLPYGTSIAFRDVFFNFLMMMGWFFCTCFCKLTLINLTLKGERCQHVLALFAIVNKGNIKDTIFSIICVCVCVCLYALFFYILNCVVRFELVKSPEWYCFGNG